ncbi:uncharacterized protein TNCV_3411621 [Trichonephila clavipes]|nr:uncharacterized protein TNCV_3411621 [Trichonephila clavipes]
MDKKLRTKRYLRDRNETRHERTCREDMQNNINVQFDCALCTAGSARLTSFFKDYKTAAPRSHFSTRQGPGTYSKGVTRLSPHCCYLFWPALSPDLSPIEHIWNHLGWRAGNLVTLNKLEARLQQIWNEMSQDIIQNFYVSMPERIASYIRARGDSSGY